MERLLLGQLALHAGAPEQRAKPQTKPLERSHMSLVGAHHQVDAVRETVPVGEFFLHLGTARAR
jgi:hypothetical protein